MQEKIEARCPCSLMQRIRENIISAFDDAIGREKGIERDEKAAVLAEKWLTLLDDNKISMNELSWLFTTLKKEDPYMARMVEEVIYWNTY